MPGATMAVPFPSPLGMSPLGLLVKSSSSSACDIFSRSGTVIAMVAPVFVFCGSIRSGERNLEGLQKFDQCQFVGVGEPGPEIVTTVFDQVRAFTDFKQCRPNLCFQDLRRRVWVEILEFDFGERFLELQTDVHELFWIRLGVDIRQQVNRCALGYHPDTKITV